MPYGAGHHECVARRQRNSALPVVFVEHDVYLTFDQDEQLVTIGMHLAAMGWALGHAGLAGETTGDCWMRPSLLQDWFDPSVVGELNGVLRKVDRAGTMHETAPVVTELGCPGPRHLAADHD